MSMYLKFGGYVHDQGECAITISRTSRVEHGIVVGYTERWNVQGRLQITSTGDPAADRALLSARISALQLAYQQQNADLGLYFDNGTPSTHFLQSARTAGGTRVTKPPEFPIGVGAEYSTFRNFALSVEADFLDSSIGLVSWTESLSLTGGGPQFGYLLTLNGPPQKQLLRQQTTFRAMQQGEAIGLNSYPVAPAPLWPADEHGELRNISQTLPERTGLGNSAVYHHFKTRWSYVFESSAPLLGAPTAWPN
jgi:hypothetical protein